jgi:hypothetical protein
MCSESALVPIPPLLWDAGAVYKFDESHPEYGINEAGERCLRLDACIVPAVQALWTAGIVTLSCCCGHGDPWGVVTIQTQVGVGQRGAIVMRAERFEEMERAEADLARGKLAGAGGAG